MHPHPLIPGTVYPRTECHYRLSHSQATQFSANSLTYCSELQTQMPVLHRSVRAIEELIVTDAPFYAHILRVKSSGIAIKHGLTRPSADVSDMD
jgi:hypothetical protein